MELEARARLARDSLIHHLNKRRKGAGEDSHDEEEEEEDSSEEARVSRLFYLQLYSSVLKASDEIRRNRRKRKKQKQKKQSQSKSAKEVSKVLQRSFSWMDVTRRVLSRQDGQEQQQQQHPQLISQRSLGEEREKDDSITVVVMDRQRLTATPPSANNNNRHFQGRTIEPVLNTRMKILNASIRGGNSSNGNGHHHHNHYATHSRTPSTSTTTVDNFSLRPREDHSHKLVVTRTRECHLLDKAVFRNALYIAAIAFCFVTAILILLSPTSPSPSLQTNFMRDPHPSSGPGVSLCLPVPFSRSKLLRNRVEPSLAAFVMYAISPFNPAGKALEKRGETHEALSSLTTDYRKLLSNIASSRQLIQHQSGELRRLLRALTLTCHDVVTSCRLNGAEMSGSNCCRSVLSRTEFTLRHGLCFSADNLSSLRVDGSPPMRQQNMFFFPITERSVPVSFTLKLNATNLATGDMFAKKDMPDFRIVLKSRRGTGFGSSEASQMDVRAGQAVAMAVGKRAVDNRRPFDFFAGGDACNDGADGVEVVVRDKVGSDGDAGDDTGEDPKQARWTRRSRVQKQRRADCRSSAVQVNYSRILVFNAAGLLLQKVPVVSVIEVGEVVIIIIIVVLVVALLLSVLMILLLLLLLLMILLLLLLLFLLLLLMVMMIL